MSESAVVEELQAFVDQFGEDSLGGRALARITELEAENVLLRETVTEECRALASATVYSASAMGVSRLDMGAEMVRLGYAGLRAERDGYAATIEEIRMIPCWRNPETKRGGFDVDGREWQVVQDILATVDTSAAVQAIRDKAFEEAAVIAEGVYPLETVVLGDPPRRIVLAILSLKGAKHG